MNSIRFENSGQARNYIEDIVEKSFDELDFGISDLVVALSVFKSHRNYDEAYYVDKNILNQCIKS